MKHRARQLLLLALLPWCACGEGRSWLGWGRAEREHTQGHATLGGEVVSTVDGVAITVAEVQALMNASGLSARAALTRLQDERLLTGEAARRGYGDAREVVRVARQARVQALLANDVERITVAQAEIAAAYERQSARFHVPELRASVHVLAALPATASAQADAAARALAVEATVAFTASSDWDATAKTFAGRTSEHFKVVVQRLPETARGGFVEPFDLALFAAIEPGAVREPVKTQYGWHAIYVTRIVSPKDVTLQQATPELRAELTADKREKQLASVLSGLGSKIPVAHERAAERLFGEMEL